MAVVLRALEKVGVSKCLWRTRILKNTKTQAGEEKINHINFTAFSH